MPPKKNPAPKKAAKTPAKPIQITREELERRSQALKQAAAKVDGYGRPIAKQIDPNAAATYQITFNNGTVLYAEGEHAEVMFKFIQECEQICSTQGLAHYEGPPFLRFSKEQWEAFKVRRALEKAAEESTKGPNA